MGIPRVKVVNPNESWMGTECYIDGKKIKSIKSVDFRVAVDEIPKFTFETIGLPDIDMSGDIRFRFTPETVQQAVMVLRNELLTKGTLYNCFLESMLSALDDKFWDSRNRNGHDLDLGEEDFKEAAILMLNRLIGIEDKGGLIMPNCNKCCGTCEYGSYDKMNGYVCVNDQSEYAADFVEYDHSCIDWEQKRRKCK